MGLYDTVRLKCPKCENMLEVQSKAGESAMHDYWEDKVPVEIAQDIMHDEVFCETCGRRYMIIEKPKKQDVMELTLVPL